MAIRIPRPDPGEYHPRYREDIERVPDTDDFAGLLREQVRETARFLTEQGQRVQPLFGEWVGWGKQYLDREGGCGLGNKN